MSFRTEEKLKVDPSRLPDFLSWLAESGASILYPCRQIISVYLDNDRLAMYHDSEEGVLPRKKLRLRRYEPSSTNAEMGSLETKISSVEGRFKTSVPLADLPNLATFSFVDNQYGICHPRVTVSYRRSYFIVNGLRITIDQDLSYQSISASRSPFTVSDPSIAIEVKGPHQLSPEVSQEAVPWDRARFSKYCRAIQMTILDFPARTG